MQDLGVELCQRTHARNHIHTATAAVWKETELFTKAEELAKVPSVVVFGWPPMVSVWFTLI